MSFAVVVCPQCHEPWAVDSRHASASCPSCRKKVELAHRTKLWEGPDAREAQQHAALHRLRMAAKTTPAGTPSYQPLPRPPRHDSPAEAAAASARGIANKGARAERVAATLTQPGPAAHEELLHALELAGLERERAEAEVVRMLAMDVLMEPKAGHYRVLSS